MEKQLFKEGDTIYCWHIAGKEPMKVININTFKTPYPVSVMFKNILYTFTLDGRNFVEWQPTLSFTPYDPINGGFSQERPIELPEKGQLVYVRGICGQPREGWHMRYFSHYENGKYYCFDLQKKSGETTDWTELSLTNPLEEK